MAVFISVTTSPFEDVFNERSQQPVTQNVRRPFRGIELKKDTYATLRVYDALNRPIPFIDSSAPPAQDGGTIGQSLEYSNFILQSIQEQRVEKQQIVETFGEDYIFFFGERPRIYNVNALLLNTRNFNWKSEWWTNYENTLRGTRLLEQNARMYLYFDDVVIEGYMLQAQAMQTVEDPYKLPLMFQIFCTNYQIIGDVGSVFTPVYDDQLADSSPDASATTVPPDDQDIQASNAVKSGASQDSLTGFLTDAAKFANDATFTIQRALEQARNTLYGRTLSFPNTGIGNQIFVPPIENLAKFPTAPGASGERVPIYQQRDEYTAYIAETTQPQFDQNEIQRVQQLLKLNSPQELDQKARGTLQKLGINVDRPSAGTVLLGRAAFAGVQTFGSFGIRQADGIFNMATGIPGITGTT